MSTDERVEDLGIAKDLHARIHELCPDTHRENAADHAAHHGEDEVHRADVLVIGRVKPAPPATRAIAVGGICICFMSHDIFAIFGWPRGPREDQLTASTSDEMPFGSRHNSRNARVPVSATRLCSAQLVTSKSMPSKV